MTLWESFRVGLAAIAGNRLRSVLTMLGIIIGVASVITMVAVGVGAQKQIAEQIRALGANVLIVYSTRGSDGGTDAASARHALVEADAPAMVGEIPLVSAAAPFAWSSGRIIRGNRNASVVLWGTTADYFAIREWALAAGRAFLPEEEAGSGKVAMIGAAVAEELFGAADPVGAEVRILNVPFRIVGVLTEMGGSAEARSHDRGVFMPLGTLKRRIAGAAESGPRDAVEYILVKTVSEEAIEPARAEIGTLLRQRHQVSPGRKAAFEVGNPAAELAAQESTAATFAWLMASVASVSLIVGGISIMNIMLVSVTERTREIGLRMALGARRRDIRRQFLMEALSLCLLGGLIGLAIGVSAALVVASAAGWPIFIGLDAVMAAIGFAAAVGLFFGWYPARKAARLEPIEALRSD